MLQLPAAGPLWAGGEGFVFLAHTPPLPRSGCASPLQASPPGLDRNRQPALWLRIQVPEAHSQIAVMLAWSQLRSQEP